jgi:hypothetical protein
MIGGGQERSTGWRRDRAVGLLGWAFVVGVLTFYAWRMVGIGLDWRQSFWVYWAPTHLQEDIDNAMRYGDMVLREAEIVAEADEAKKSPAQRDAEQRRIDAGDRPATIARPGPGLFDSPFNAQNFRRRWQRLRPVYSQIIRGWVQTYERLRNETPDGNYDLDYPPMRLLVMTLWTWHVESAYPGVTRFPRVPQRVFDPDRNQSVVATMDVAQPVLKFNAACEGATAISVFVLVWLWMERGRRTDGTAALAAASGSWRRRWGDPMLLAPVVLFAVATFLRPNLNWQMSLPSPAGGEVSPIDVRITSVGWWTLLLLRYLSAVCLARFLPWPYRAPMCALVAATLAWLNPASILDSFGWMQWDTWLPPFFLVAAILATLDAWVAAGLVLGVGCMFKGQLLFVMPVLLACPLLAGWPGRFMRIVAGTAAGAGLILWPWLVTNGQAEKWIFFAVTTAAFFCLLSAFRGFLWRQGRQAWNQLSTGWDPWVRRATLAGAALVLIAWVYLLLLLATHRGTPLPSALLAVGIVLVPWFLRRRLIGAWLLLAFAASLWLVYFYVGGSSSWWEVGFVYGTQKHDVMQLGAVSLSNLSSILHERYDWQLHDVVTTFKRPIFGMTELDVQSFCAVIFVATVLLCAVAAAVHVRRKDPRFLIALVAPWVLFTTLLTQMTARYTVLPAVIGSLLIGVSAEMSLLPFLQTVLACVMLGNQMLGTNSDAAPVAYSITRPTYPDLGWLMVLLAAVFLCSALMPSWRRARGVEVV